MKPSIITPDEFQRLAIAVAELPFVSSQREPSDYVLDVLETVLNFHMQTTVVVEALSYFRQEVQGPRALYDHHALRALLATFPDTPAGNQAASRCLWNNRHWTRVALLRRLLEFLESVNVTDQATLRTWACHADYARDFKHRVKGLGFAVFQWLRIRCGADTIKPDVWVINFARRVLGRRLAEPLLVESFERLTPWVGESLVNIDVTIWHYEKGAMATDVPGLRLLAWHGLKRRFEATLTSPPAGLGRDWTIQLADNTQLRYDAAGLDLLPTESLFGGRAPGETRVQLRQTHWTEGLMLSLSVHQTAPLVPSLWRTVKRRLKDQDWECRNLPVFAARLELEESTRFAQDHSLDDLNDWVADQVAAVIEALQAMVGVDCAN
ncbi:hypothetical protein HW932_10850 [Allochromatium humboldtianum]|uniref:Uncharacterized protein n=1 Tax=Allochromatium humboldtianum TaxID=504901 RepID=A0A850R4Z7_9GAMM|nr:hypothetical protein [Allochromatium humboldtianum]NVZ09759.1 hypothetical protein [Allochromatium humboldtianum]